MNKYYIGKMFDEYDIIQVEGGNYRTIYKGVKNSVYIKSGVERNSWHVELKFIMTDYNEFYEITREQAVDHVVSKIFGDSDVL